MYNKTKIIKWSIIFVIGITVASLFSLREQKVFAANSTDYTSSPPFVTAGVPPLVMLVMGKNHKLYYEAYNDASDLNEDGVLDVGYNPAIEYYGYFDSYKYYTYSSTNSRFEPAGVAADKKAPAGAYWSGDFLNYLTMSRMDCLRKVLYGGFRSTDTATETVLKRAYIPQDAHSWGKEYESVAVNGFNIEDYTPLSLPVSGTRHLFACTTLSDNGDPLLRVLPNNTHRIWEWVAKERPVCDSSLVSSGTVYSSHPANHLEFTNMVDMFANADHFQGTTSNNVIDTDNDNLSDTNPFDSNNDNYLTIFTGTINVLSDDTYKFAVDGDDAVEVIIDGTVVAGWYGGHGKCTCNTHQGSIDLTAGDHTIVFRHEEMTGGDNYYLRWNQGNSIDTWESVPAARFPSGLTQNFYGLETSASTITDYKVYVKVCDPLVGLESNSQLYSESDGSNPVFKPVGILQKYGETDRMYFGLISGSYKKNTSGGVLRKNIRSIRDEINPDTGEFIYKDSATNEGIIKTIDLFRIVDFTYSNHQYNSNCGWIATRPVNEGECRMWGNPTAEMMYEAMRYFSGSAAPTPEFTYGTDSSYDDNELGLPKPAWIDPYLMEDIDADGVLDSGEDLNSNGLLDGFDYCAKPFVLVLSDINPTFDSNQLPGSAFGTVTTSLGTMNVTTLGDLISTQEGGIGSHFIGQSSTFDGACTPKTVAGFGSIRGLCPEEPTKQGSYYSAAVAYYGNKEDLHSVTNEQKVSTYCVGLASPLPTIDIKVGTGTITLVPFAKSVGGYSISASQGSFQPTNTIVDFFVESVGKTSGKFRINYEDVEQGADHDMDAIVEYTYQVYDANGDPLPVDGDPANGVEVRVSLNSAYAAGSIIQHMGYIVSGSTQDGTYLEVRDEDTGASSDPDYFLDTPPGVLPGGSWNDGTALPLTASRTFYPGTSASATFLKNPLWYAAKWGGFQDYNDNDLPDQQDEWDDDGDGKPDTYFYVQNALKLEQQLNQSFSDILRRTASGTAASVISQSRSGEGAVYQAVFYPEYKDRLANTVSWVGSVHALFVDSYGNMREDSNSNDTLDITAPDSAPDLASAPDTDRVIVFDGTVVKKFKHQGEGMVDLTGIPEFTGTIDDVKFLWKATEWLNELTPAQAITQRLYNQPTSNRYIFTFIDNNPDTTDDNTDIDMVAESGEKVAFECDTVSDSDLTDVTKIFPYLNLFPTFEDEPLIAYDGSFISIDSFRAETSDFNDFLKHQSERLVNYIRGADQGEYISTGTSATYILPSFRSRQADYDEDGDINTWRLGDIVYSTPTVVGRPAENYHLLYGDESYAFFLSKFLKRRQVVYAGSNDGLFHAFNAGFYDSTLKKFDTKEDLNGDGVDDAIEFALGSELWAYVPYNLLPHLYWLTEDDYPHVYYNDLQPKIFDAKILPDGTHYTDTDGQPNWGTFLVGGMRLGGGRIIADMNKTDGALPKSEDLNANGVLDAGEDTNGNGKLDGDRVMTSAYYIFDITDPETEPVLIAEISLNQMGYTLCNPTIVPIKSVDSETPNDWYLVFGSGPADSSGYAAAGTSGSKALTHAVSEQTGKLFVVDLKALVHDGELKVLDGNGILQGVSAASGTHYYQELDDDAMISDPVTVDYDLDYSADVVYFGTVEGDHTSGWGGKLRRLVIDNDSDTANWDGDSILFDTSTRTALTEGQPITSEANATIDDRGRMWVYFGTGRYYVKSDEAISTQQTFYGIVEPFDDLETDEDEPGFQYKTTDETFNWDEVVDTLLIDVSSAEILDDKTVNNITGITSWDWTDTDEGEVGLIDEVNKFTDEGGGWLMDFRTAASNFVDISEKERSLSQPALFGEILTFSSYTPSGEMCSFEGTSNLYALYYKTGTPYFESVVGFDNEDENSGNDDGVIDIGERKMKKMLPLGKGLAGTPNIHSGEDDGTKAYIQTSTGDIITIKQINPGVIYSGVVTWKEGGEECP
ncbi:PilY1 [Desulfamplus magnetovallimortis]|uniref:PilY1 n=1 Tax=Desulfamplus magnetovallimortis TaxID=1246637 RepID=A0A1W1HIH0_9BACT|nr:PA14 domain-containing protein [Desulfamplus magnetovallimortis]SLM32182.1 PilY1 [Desulfamplus magnetovallimortis]